MGDNALFCSWVERKVLMDLTQGMLSEILGGGGRMLVLLL